MPLIAMRAAGAHAVARELARVDAVPHADHVGGVHAEDELAQRGVDELRDRPWRAAVMRFAVADEAALGGDLHDHGVALHRAADAEREHAVSGGIGIRKSDRP